MCMRYKCTIIIIIIWSHSSSVAEWKSSCLGCHSHLSFGGLLCSLGCQRSKISSRVGSNQEGYSGLAADYLFQPIAVEILGPINESADFLSLLAKKISQHSGNERETAFLFQRVSALLQRYNSVLLHNSFVREDYPE